MPHRSDTADADCGSLLRSDGATWLGVADAIGQSGSHATASGVAITGIGSLGVSAHVRLPGWVHVSAIGTLVVGVILLAHLITG